MNLPSSGAFQVKDIALVISAYSVCLIYIRNVQPAFRVEDRQQDIIVAGKKSLQSLGHL